MAEDAFAIARHGQRRANADAPRERRIVVRASEDEYAFVSALARAQGISRQAVLMRAVLTGGTDAAAQYQELREALVRTRFQLANVANNVNQLAHQANSFALGSDEPVDAEDVRAVMRDVRAVIARVEAVAAGVGDRGDR